MLRPYPSPPSPVDLFLGLFGGREADHLDARAVRDVHRLHHVEIFAVRCRLDEQQLGRPHVVDLMERLLELGDAVRLAIDRKSTRLNSSPGYISYAVFCLQK